MYSLSSLARSACDVARQPVQAFRGGGNGTHRRCRVRDSVGGVGCREYTSCLARFLSLLPVKVALRGRVRFQSDRLPNCLPGRASSP